MKNAKKRLISALLAVLMALTVLPISAIGASAAVTDGTTFSLSKLYQSSRRLDSVPLSILTTVCIGTDVDAPGVIFSNYEKASFAFITLEVISGGVVKLSFCNSAWTSSSQQITSVTFDGVDVRTGDWVDIAVINDGGEFKLYVDGALKKAVTASNAYSDKIIARNEFVIGADLSKSDYSTANTNYFKGAMKSFALYSTPLTASEV